ncbi:unnamed protein product, partial [Polarella glacialis]
EQERRHAQDLSRLRGEAQELRQRLTASLARRSKREPAVEQSSLPDSCFIRRVEWTINDFSARTRDVARNQALWSEKFTILGAADVQLEFFPQGRDSTAFPGFCALFLWCPAGVQMKYRLQVGKHFAAPDEDSYDMRMGHGHSNFCMLE